MTVNADPARSGLEDSLQRWVLKAGGVAWRCVSDSVHNALYSNVVEGSLLAKLSKWPHRCASYRGGTPHAIDIATPYRSCDVF